MQARGINVIAKRFRCKNEMIFEPMQAHTDNLIAFVSYRPQVDVLPLPIASDQFDAYVNKLFNTIGK